jgi:hypothetical protein
MSQDENPLKALLVSSEDLNRALLASSLAPYAGIDDQTGALLPRREFSQLTVDRRLVVALLANKAAHALNLMEGPEGLSAKDLAAQTGAKYNSVKPALSGLRSAGVITTTKNRLNIVPNGRLHEAVAMVGRGE